MVNFVFFTGFGTEEDVWINPIHVSAVASILVKDGVFGSKIYTSDEKFFVVEDTSLEVIEKLKNCPFYPMRKEDERNNQSSISTERTEQSNSD